MRIVLGQRGILAKPLPTLCCHDTIPEGVEIEVWKVHSPKRVWIREYPARMFLNCGHSLDPVDREAFMQQSAKTGPIGDLDIPANQAWPVHKVKASAVWFVVEEGEEWKS